MVERDADGIARIVGLSGGKDSTAMSLALAERAEENPTPVDVRRESLFD